MTDANPKPRSASDHWACLFSAQRLGSKSQAPVQDSARSSFHKDYDRLVFSHSFRQLNQKT
ncbi:deoxyguanosinetriphosphate triphosphohydrolase, partial [Psychrobacter sp. T6-1]